MSETLADSSRREAKSSVLFDKDHQRWIFGATRKARVRRSLVAEAVEDDDYDGEGENLDDDYDPYDDPNVSLVRSLDMFLRIERNAICRYMELSFPILCLRVSSSDLIKSLD